MDKAGHVFIDMDTVRNQRPVIGHIHHIDIPFVIDMRHNDLHIHAASGCSAQIFRHLPVNNQIRCCNINIIPGLIDQMRIHILRRIIGIIGRPITKRLHKSVTGHFDRRHVNRIIRGNLIPHRHFPHLKKN